MPVRALWIVVAGLALSSVSDAGEEPPARVPPKGAVPMVGQAPHALLLEWDHLTSAVFTAGSFQTLSTWGLTTSDNITIIACRAMQVMRLPNHANSMAVGRKSSLLVLGENTGVVEVRDGRTFEVRHQLPVGAPYSIYAVAISADEEQIAACGTDGSACLWNLKNPKQLHRLPKAGREGERLSALAFAPDGRLLASLSRYGRLVLWDTTTHQPLGQADIAAGEDSELAFSKKGDRIVAVYRMNVISWHPEHEPQPTTFYAPPGVAPRYPKDVEGSRPAISGPKGEAIRFAGVSTLTPAGDAASILENGGIAVWDPVTGRVLATLPPPPEATNWEQPGSRFESIRYSRDGRLIGATTEAGELFVWNAPDSSVVKRP